ncbi:MAG: type II toxin-antitoxin system death-on-curing family toxin [Clostridia bacterium]|nr:type II toxin-antitoxin system death-on-curing family toxin [Clostridia bacterium]
MKKLTKEHIILLHHELLAETGGADGVRDVCLLESALNAPFQSFDGVDSFPSIQQKAARLGFGLIKNHAFVDGNKRIGTHAMLVFLILNGIEVEYTQDELTAIALSVADGTCLFEDLVRWIAKHQV